MRYFVLGEDGHKYGPADVPLLNEWIEEGRLLPRMMLEEEGTHHRVAAASVSGLDFYAIEAPRDAPMPTQPGEVATLTYDQPVAESTQTDVFLAWSMVLITLCLSALRSTAGFLGLFTTLLGVMAALKAKERGHEAAAAAITMNLIALALWAVARLYFITS